MDNSDKKIISDILSENIDVDKLRDLFLCEIDGELEKDEIEIDCDLIKENIETLIRLDGKNSGYDIVDGNIINITGLSNATVAGSLGPYSSRTVLNGHKRLHRSIKKVAAIAACFAVIMLISGNIIAAKCFNSDMFGVIRYVGGVAKFTPEDNDKTSSEAIEANEKIYNAMRAECKKNGFTGVLPHKFPKGMELSEVKSKSDNINFILKSQSGNMSLVVNIMHIVGCDTVNTNSNIESKKINGITFYISNAGNYCTVIYKVDNYIYDITATYDRKDIESIISSIDNP